MIKVDPEISVKNIQEFHAALLDEFRNSDEVLIDFSDVGRVDLSVVQLVIAAGRAAKTAGKTVRLKSVQRFVKYQMQICGIRI